MTDSLEPSRSLVRRCWRTITDWLHDTIQLLVWLLFQPSRWREHVASIDPALNADFNLLQLNASHWKNPRLRKTLFVGFGIFPLIALGLQRVFWRYPYCGSGQPLREELIGKLNLLGGVYEIGGILAVVGSLAGGMLAGPIHILIYPLVLMAYWDTPESYCNGGGFGHDAGIAATGVVAFAFCFGFSTQARLHFYQSMRTLFGNRFLGGIIVGLVSGAALVFAVLFLLKTQQNIVLYFVSIFGLAAGLTLIQPGRRPLRKWGVGLGLVVTVFLLVFICTGIANWAAEARLPLGAAMSRAVQPAFQILSSLLLMVPIWLAGWLGGPLAASVAATLSGGVGYVLVSYQGAVYESSRAAEPHKLTLLIGTISSLLGFALPWIQTYLVYPLQAAWNQLGYHIDLRRPSGDDRCLRRNAAFWDETQSLRLPALDAHIALVAEHSPHLARRAISELALGPQRWAAQLAQLELDARMLERCRSIEDIAAANIELEFVETNSAVHMLLAVLKSASKDTSVALQQQNPYHRHALLSGIIERMHGLTRDLERMSTEVSQRFLCIGSAPSRQAGF